MATNGTVRDMQKEGRGWIYIVLILLAFPILFFTCVYLPIWLGIASPY